MLARAQSLQLSSAHNFNLELQSDVRFLIHRLCKIIQQESNARIKLPDINMERHPSDHDKDASSGQLE
jgi:hypothetical protein